LQAPKLLGALRERLAKNPSLAKELGAVVAFKVKDAGVEFTVDGTSGTLKDGFDPKATTTVTLTDESFAELARGAPPQRLYQHGGIRVDGSVKPVQHLGIFKQLA
jgi:ubiquinone biosynthesis protein UbiJ